MHTLYLVRRHSDSSTWRQFHLHSRLQRLFLSMAGEKGTPTWLTVVSSGTEDFQSHCYGILKFSAYIQRMINRILQRQRAYARAYIDNIVIFSNTLEEHLKHLHNVFITLKRMRICLSSEKSFLTYSSVQLLEQWVDALELAIEDKLVAIAGLCFSISLSQLEKYLGLTEYLWQYISKYAAIIKPLQLQKPSWTKASESKRRKECKKTSSHNYQIKWVNP
jgi:hypothetical protein